MLVLSVVEVDTTHQGSETTPVLPTKILNIIMFKNDYCFSANYFHIFNNNNNLAGKEYVKSYFLFALGYGKSDTNYG